MLQKRDIIYQKWYYIQIMISYIQKMQKLYNSLKMLEITHKVVDIFGKVV